MKLNDKGFAFIPLLVAALSITVIAGVGYYVYSSSQEKDEPQVIKQVDPGMCCEPEPYRGGAAPDKPVIYLYPERTQEISVKLDYVGKLTATYPDYDYNLGGWNVTASPGGSLINHADGKEYSYLFWEGTDNTQYDLSSGFIVKGSDTKKFLQDTLAELGLTPKEYNEMIVYWLPKMQYNKYNLVHFSGKQYEDSAKLTISPEPDSLLRVFMVFKPLDEPVELRPQELKTFERKGFTVVEWGGTELR